MKNAMGQVGLAFPGEGVMMRVFSPALVSSVTGGLQQNTVQQLPLMLCYTMISLFWTVITSEKPMECLLDVSRPERLREGALGRRTKVATIS